MLAAAPGAIVTGGDVLAGTAHAAAVRRRPRGRRFDGGLLGRLVTPALPTVAIPTGHDAERLAARVPPGIDGPTGDPGEVVIARARARCERLSHG